MPNTITAGDTFRTQATGLRVYRALEVASVAGIPCVAGRSLCGHYTTVARVDDVRQAEAA